MTLAEYHAHPALSRSRLWKLHESPQKFKWAEEHPEDPTPAFRLGAAFHKFTLEPETFDDEYVHMPKIDRRTKEGKAVYEALLEKAGNRTILSYDEIEAVVGMRNAVMANSTARVLIEKGIKEHSIFWKDEDTGVELKCRPDIFIPDDDLKVIVDLKSTTSSDTKNFTNECLRYGYDVQSAWYKKGVQTEYPGEYAFVFIAVEKNPPYAVNVMEMDKLMIEYGYIRFRELLDTYVECQKTGNWYGYNGNENIMNKIELPAWVE